MIAIAPWHGYDYKDDDDDEFWVIFFHAGRDPCSLRNHTHPCGRRCFISKGILQVLRRGERDKRLERMGTWVLHGRFNSVYLCRLMDIFVYGVM